MTTDIGVPLRRVHNSPTDNLDLCARLVEQRLAIEDALTYLEDCTEPMAIAARLRLARV